jgi:hypothetical protein
MCTGAAAIQPRSSSNRRPIFRSRRLVRDDDDALSLRVPAGWCTPDHARDPVDLRARNRVGKERAVHAPLREDLAELHRASV